MVLSPSSAVAWQGVPDICHSARECPTAGVQVDSHFMYDPCEGLPLRAPGGREGRRRAEINWRRGRAKATVDLKLLAVGLDASVVCRSRRTTVSQSGCKSLTAHPHECKKAFGAKVSAHPRPFLVSSRTSAMHTATGWTAATRKGWLGRLAPTSRSKPSAAAAST